MTKTDKTTAQADSAKENKTNTEILAEKIMIKALRVRAPNGRFRRAGITFGSEDQIIRLSDLSGEQISQIKGEPMLAASEIEIEAGAIAG